jgi:beta-N-acetylhexosaminidase
MKNKDSNHKMLRFFGLFFYSTILLFAGVLLGYVLVIKSPELSMLITKGQAEELPTSNEVIDNMIVEEAEESLNLDKDESYIQTEGQTKEIDSVEQKVNELMSTLSLEEKIYQLFIVTQEQLTGSSAVTKTDSVAKEAIHDKPVGGIIYFEENIVEPEQCKKMIQKIQSYSHIPLFIAVDEEGGRVARLGQNSTMGTTAFPSMSTIGSTGDTERAYEVGKTIGEDIAQYGFNVDFAPVADVNSNPDNPVIGDRSFNSDPKVVADMVSAAVRGFKDSGILCTLKHFPGHGDTKADSHYGYAEVDKNLEELKAVEFVPFEAGIKAGADFVMVGHLSTPKVTENGLPATLSKEMLDILKKNMGFDGLVITDSMSMGAITEHYSASEAAVMALEAGIDIILMPANLDEAASGIKEAVNDGRITEDRIDESVRRILITKINAAIMN